DGFAALAQEDTNADGLVNAFDANWTKLKLWRDLNQDGLSQGGELSTLAANGITGIELTPTGGSADLGNGNSVSGRATVHRAGGVDGEIEAVALADAQAANLDLADNPFYREFTTAVPLTEAAQALPDMRGSGWVRDLREAMSMGSAAAAQLQALVQAYAEASTWAAQQALLPQLLQAWAHTNEVRAVPGPEDSHMRYVVAGNAELSARLQQAAPVVQVFNGAVMADSAIRAPVLTTGDDGLPITTYTFSELRTGMMLDSYRALSASVH
ncbi:hypothetical protein L6R53_33480, partial [Myxococcota bacterium]|nr:hypothetical protein [Myxococcota bacterium]